MCLLSTESSGREFYALLFYFYNSFGRVSCSSGCPQTDCRQGWLQVTHPPALVSQELGQLLYDVTVGIHKVYRGVIDNKN